jgi:hypothetical protein
LTDVLRTGRKRWWATGELTLTLLGRRAILLSTLLTLGRVLLLLALWRWASRVGLRSTLWKETSQYSTLSISTCWLRARENEHIRQILVEGIQGSVGRAQGYKEQDCTVRDCRAPAAVVHMTVVRPAEVVSSRLVAVGRTAAAVHTAVVEPAIGTRRWEGKVKAPACSGADRVGAVQGRVSSVAAGLAPRMRRQQPDVLREACRCEMKSRR